METKRSTNHLLSLLWHWLWFILLISGLMGGSAYWFSSRQPAVYEAATKILIDEGVATTANSSYQALLTSERRAKTYAELLTDSSLLQAAIRELAWQEDAAELKQRIDVSTVRDTQLIVIKVRDTDPARATLLANTLITLFTTQTEQRQADRHLVPQERLTEQLAVLAQQIQADEAELSKLETSDTTAAAHLQTALAEHRTRQTMLRQNLEQLHASQVQTLSNVVQVAPAQLAARPVAPRVWFTTSLAAFVGLVLASVLVFLRDILDDTIRSPEQLSERVGLPILGTIGHLRTRYQGVPFVAAKPRDTVSEAFRTLRTNIQFTSIDRPIQTLMITSAGPGEGKSSLAANLSAIFAQAGKHTTIVDADLRRPTVHRQFNVTNVRGLSDLFVQARIQLQSFVQYTQVDGVRVLTTGQLPPNPAELLASDKMAQILINLKQQSDLVILDAPPVNPVTDAVLLAMHADAVLLVVRYGKTKFGPCLHTVNQLRRGGANVIGVIVNDIPNRHAAYSYAYQGDYSHKPALQQS